MLQCLCVVSLNKIFYCAAVILQNAPALCFAKLKDLSCTSCIPALQALGLQRKEKQVRTPPFQGDEEPDPPDHALTLPSGPKTRNQQRTRAIHTASPNQAGAPVPWSPRDGATRLPRWPSDGRSTSSSARSRSPAIGAESRPSQTSEPRDAPVLGGEERGAKMSKQP